MDDKKINMELKTLLIFDLVLRMKSISKTVAALSISVTTVNRALNHLREKYGDPLFITKNQQLEATVLAHQLHKSIQPLLLNNMSSTTEKTLLVDSHRLIISCGSHISHSVIPLIYRLAKEGQMSLTVLTLLPEYRSRYLDNLLNKSTDVVFDYYAVNHPEVLYRKLFSEELCIVCSIHHPRISHSVKFKQYLQESHAILDREIFDISPSESKSICALREKKIGFQSSCYTDILAVVEVSELICAIPASMFLKFSNAFTIKSVRYNFNLGFKNPVMYMSHLKDFQDESGRNKMMNLLNKLH